MDRYKRDNNYYGGEERTKLYNTSHDSFCFSYIIFTPKSYTLFYPQNYFHFLSTSQNTKLSINVRRKG
jgi:hypothetical protein